jgi:RNA recognition motif-containing protein
MVNQPNREIYVNGLPKTLDSYQLKLIFQEVGEIKKATVVKPKDFYTSTYGFVQFKEISEATQAIQQFNGTIIYQKFKLIITYAKPKTIKSDYKEDKNEIEHEGKF